MNFIHFPFIFVFTFTCLSIYKCEPFSIPLTPVESATSSLAAVSLDLHTPDKIKGNFLIDTSSFYIAILPPLSLDIKVNLNSSIVINYLYGNVTGYETKADVFIPPTSISINNMLIVVIKDLNGATFPKGIQGILGLGFNYEDYNNILSFSIIERLYSSKQISERTYKLNYTSYKENIGELIIGKVDLHEEENTNKYGSCRTLRMMTDENILPYWRCALKYIKFDYFTLNDFSNHTLSSLLNEPIAFDSSLDSIIVPEYFFNKTVLKILEPKLGQGQSCTLIRNSNTKKIYIRCKKNDFTFINTVDFAFNPFVMRIKDKELFFLSKEEEDSLVFLIQSEMGGERFLLGQSFLKKYNVIYDKSNERIRFENLNGDLVNLTRNIYYMIFFICLVLIAMVMFISIFWYLVMMCVKKGFNRMRMKRKNQKKKRDYLISELDLDM